MGACLGTRRSPPRQPRPPPAVKTLPLKREDIKWRSEVPITMGQLHSKRDEFWETAPVFEGRREIWDALKAAATAAEDSDFPLAQAIIDGANIYIPHGVLSEAYDELGARYKVPVYCLSRPLNLLCEESTEAIIPPDGTSDDADAVPLRLRLSSTSQDLDLLVRPSDSVGAAKARLSAACPTTTTPRQRWFYGGRLLEDRARLSELAIPPDHLIQVVFAEQQQQQQQQPTPPAKE